jgi:hypothetical protein
MHKGVAYFRIRAAQCRCLADLLQPQDSIRAALLALAEEFEAKAAALDAESAQCKLTCGTEEQHPMKDRSCE